MKFNQLRDFIAVADAGSLRGASRRLGLAQPAITRSIKELEHSIEAQLFIRESRGVRLTEVGKDFYPRALAIQNDLKRARDSARQKQGALDGDIVVGLSVAGHLGILPEALSRFQRKYPRVRLRLIEGFLPMLEADLKSGQIDLYIGPVQPDWENSDLQTSKLFDNERVIVSRVGHPLVDKRKLADLSNAYWVTTSITHTAEDELKDIFSLHGLKPPKLGGQGQSALSILTLVLNSDFLAMLPVQWSRSPILGDLLHEFVLEEKFDAPPISLIHKTGIGQTPAAEYFCHIVRDIANGMLSSDRISLSSNQN